MAPRSILVVDDDGAILRLIATILTREHYDVDTACGGRAALSKIALKHYNVIILDLMMPDVSGLDVLRSLSASIPEVKCVIILSAASSLEIASASNPNVFSALRKPFDNVDLVSAVRKCVDATCEPLPAAA